MTGPPTRRSRPPKKAGPDFTIQPTSTNGSQQDNPALHEAGVFTEAIITTATYALSGELPMLEALEQVVRLGCRVETFIALAAAA